MLPLGSSRRNDNDSDSVVVVVAVAVAVAVEVVVTDFVVPIVGTVDPKIGFVVA